MSALTGCSYGVSFRDCEVACTSEGDEACPDGFSCIDGLCRVEGAGEACLAPGEVTLRQTADDMVARNLEFGCTNPDQTTSDGSWYRVFSLVDEGVAQGLDVTKVTFGLCFAVGDPMVELAVGTYAGGAGDATLDLAKITRITSVDVPITATQISRVVEVPLTASVPADANLIVEIVVPDLVGTDQQVNVGFTAGGEERPGYVRSPLCGPSNPTTTSGAGLPNAHLVLNVTGVPR